MKVSGIPSAKFRPVTFISRSSESGDAHPIVYLIFSAEDSSNHTTIVPSNPRSN